MLKGGVQHSVVVAQVKTFAYSQLPGMLIDATLNNVGRLTLAGVDFNDTIRQIAVFDGRNTRHHFDALDVRRTDGACRWSQCLARFGIVAQSLAVYLDGRSKRGVAAFGCSAS